MQFFYTGASAFQAVQNDPYQSLGGYISSSPVPNNFLNNIFGNFSWYSVQQKKVCTRGLILKNTLGFDCTDVLFGYQLPITVAATFKLEVAFVSLNPSTPNQIEKIANGEASPIFATFVTANIDPANNVDNSVDLGPLANNASIGVWLRLTLTGGLTPPSFSDVNTQKAWWAALSDPNYSITQDIQIKIKYSYNQ